MINVLLDLYLHCHRKAKIAKHLDFFFELCN